MITKGQRNVEAEMGWTIDIVFGNEDYRVWKRGLSCLETRIIVFGNESISSKPFIHNTKIREKNRRGYQRYQITSERGVELVDNFLSLIDARMTLKKMVMFIF